MIKLAIVLQALAGALFLNAWLTPPELASSERSASKELMQFGSFYLASARRMDGEPVVMFGAVNTFYHVRASAPIPFSSGARLYLARLNQYSREQRGLRF